MFWARFVDHLEERDRLRLLIERTQSPPTPVVCPISAVCRFCTRPSQIQKSAQDPCEEGRRLGHHFFHRRHRLCPGLFVALRPCARSPGACCWLSSGCASWRPASGPLALFSHRDSEVVRASVASSGDTRPAVQPDRGHALASYESSPTPYRRPNPETAASCRTSFG